MEGKDRPDCIWMLAKFILSEVTRETVTGSQVYSILGMPAAMEAYSSTAKIPLTLTKSELAS